MKMVSSAKLRKAEKQILSLYPYEKQLSHTLNMFLTSDEEVKSEYSEIREVNRVALVIFSSNGSLCGSFNSNTSKKLNIALEQYKHLGKENIIIYPIGKKITQQVKKLGFTVEGNFEEMIDKPTYRDAQVLANKLMTLFLNKEIDRVELIYHHFKSKSSQVLLNECYLPVSLEMQEDATNEEQAFYIIEPGREEIMQELLPKVIRLKLYTALLDSIASEQAARTMAMQIATDNADDLLGELNLQYNKSRQQAITSELLDIVGGSFGQD